MMFALRSRDAVKEGRTQLFVDRNLFPQTLDLLLTRSEPFGIELIVDDYDCYEFSGKEFGAVVQYPAADGAVRDYAAFVEAAARARCEGDGRSRPALAGTAESSRRMGRRHLRRFGATPGHAHGLRRPARGLHGHARGLQTSDARPHHRRLGRPAGQPRPAHGAANARAAYQARARHLEHLHRLGADGLDGGLLLRLQRRRRPAPCCRDGPHGRLRHRPRPRGAGLQAHEPALLRYARHRGRSGRHPVARPRTGHQLLLPLRGARAPLVRRGDHPRRGGRGRGPLRRGAGTQTQSRQEPRPEHAARSAAPHLADPHRGGLPLAPQRKRADALHQAAGTPRHLAGRLDDLAGVVHDETQTRRHSCNPCRWPGSRTCTPSHPSNRPKVTWS